jgi:hypothetical protein
VLLALVVAFPSLAAAQPPHHAALIVDFGDGRVVVRVVAFAGETISGVDLLQQAGLDVAVMVNLGGGAALCAVEGVGCAPTPQECFCQCRGSPCRYWSYFHLQDGAWAYAGMGAADHVLRDGDVDGWVWGDGRTAPPLLTWDEIWARNSAAQPTSPLPPSTTPLSPATAAPQPTPVPTQPAATVAPPSATLSRTPVPAPSTSVPAPTMTLAATTIAPTVPSSTPVQTPRGLSPAPLVTLSPPPGGGGGSFSWGTAAAFGGLVLLLLALGLWVRRRR